MKLVQKHTLKARTGICAAILLSFNLIAQGQQGKINWNQFRGPNGQGTAKADRIPVHFSPDSNVLWKTMIVEREYFQGGAFVCISAPRPVSRPKNTLGKDIA